MKGGREALRLFKISLHLFYLCINDVQRNDGRLDVLMFVLTPRQWG